MTLDNIKNTPEYESSENSPANRQPARGKNSHDEGEISNYAFFKSLIRDILWISVICLVIRSFIIQPVYIPSPSMMNKLLPGDYAFITKYNYGYGRFALPYGIIDFKGRYFDKTPARGDIIVFMPTSKSPDSYIKRLIGMPGDTIQIKEGILYINRQPVETNFMGVYKGPDNNKYLKYQEVLPNNQKYPILRISKELKIRHDKYNSRDLDNTREFIVPKNHLFFLGDNRDNSDDSRYGLGYVHTDNLIGKAQLIFFSTGVELIDLKLSVKDQLFRVYEWFTSIRLSRMFSYLYDKKED
jgi:signal peptidase I